MRMRVQWDVHRPIRDEFKIRMLKANPSWWSLCTNDYHPFALFVGFWVTPKDST